jgi:hypothetical protein
MDREVTMSGNVVKFADFLHKKAGHQFNLEEYLSDLADTVIVKKPRFEGLHIFTLKDLADIVPSKSIKLKDAKFEQACAFAGDIDGIVVEFWPGGDEYTVNYVTPSIQPGDVVKHASRENPASVVAARRILKVMETSARSKIVAIENASTMLELEAFSLAKTDDDEPDDSGPYWSA